MNSGLESLGTTLGITQMTPATFQAKIDAATSAEAAFGTARSARDTAFTASDAAQSAGQSWLFSARAVLTTWLGIRWNTQWAQAGFVNTSTAVPSLQAAQLRLLGALATYFIANPAQEVEAREVTAAQAAALAGDDPRGGGCGPRRGGGKEDGPRRGADRAGRHHARAHSNPRHDAGSE